MSNPLRLENLSLDNSHPAPLETAQGEREPVHLHMLSFVFKDGRRTAFDYAHLYRVDDDGMRQIQLHFTSEIVSLHGTSPPDLYALILAHRVAEIIEQDPLSAADQESPIPSATAIEITRADQGPSGSDR